jgi:hypothetical protein
MDSPRLGAAGKERRGETVGDERHVPGDALPKLEKASP